MHLFALLSTIVLVAHSAPLPSDGNAAYEALVEASARQSLVLCEHLFPGRRFDITRMAADLRATRYSNKQASVPGARAQGMSLDVDPVAIVAYHERATPAEKRDNEDFCKRNAL